MELSVSCALIKNNEIINCISVSSNISEDSLNLLAIGNGVDHAEIVNNDKMVTGSKKINGKWIMPKPWPSFILDEYGYWVPPIKRPEHGGPWIWREDLLSWEMAP